MRTKRGISVVRHMLPEPTEFERALALRQLSGTGQEQEDWPRSIAGVLLPPAFHSSQIADEVKRLGLGSFQQQVVFSFDSLFGRDCS